MLTQKIRADRGANKSNELSPIDREKLHAATATAKERMLVRDRDSWPIAERNEGPEHIAPILDRVLEMHNLTAPIGSADRD